MNISFEAPFHTFTRYTKVEKTEFYDQFINWLKGEFDLYLMEETDGLRVYYPNGMFTVKLVSKRENDFSIEIKIKSKNLKAANQISKKIETIHSHLKTVLNKTIYDK
ncbi:hypothetical protein [Flavobacterium sp. GSP6]|uniref:hypothetical protein n=1 Tax=Flavobacterium sp. GSP6 TaxID=2497488 RepID=UPI000F88E63A|nr:hypothetical protein [Flavobacterium sp. GSP6]RTZ03119.1 hypothetical protein EKM03_13555 [Flavobacterium sp. GSP6]